MRTSPLFPLLALMLACDRPVAPDLARAPALQHAAHRAIVLDYDAEIFTLFDADGVIQRLRCDGAQRFTNSRTGQLNFTIHCRVAPGARAIVYTADNNPVAPGLCGQIIDVHGAAHPVCEWTEVISASGRVVFRANTAIN